MAKLVYDVGLHRGEDSEFYLAKGFRVVGVDADPAMCKAAKDRLAPFVESGDMQIVNVAVAEQPGRLTFYLNDKSDWSTAVVRWSVQNASRGYGSEQIEVEATTLADLVRTYGHPYFIKVDIEGMDRTALNSLREISPLPDYLSIESAFPREPGFGNVRAEFSALADLGYDRFKIVPQQNVTMQVPPKPAREGKYVPYRFPDGSSGLFGEEAPGEWLELDQALETFRKLARQSWPESWLFNHPGLRRLYLRLKWHLTGQSEICAWYDIHASRSDKESQSKSRPTVPAGVDLPR